MKYLGPTEIELSTTLVHTPESNGLAERLNRTLFHKARTLVKKTNDRNIDGKRHYRTRQYCIIGQKPLSYYENTTWTAVRQATKK